MRKTYIFRALLGLLGLLFLGMPFAGQQPEIPVRLKTMKQELQRNFDALQKEQVPPYYISYSIDEVRTQSVSGTFGAITNRDDNKTSFLRIDVRVGSYHLDSSHELRGDTLSRIRDRFSSGGRAPLDESPDALRVLLWQGTDKAYKSAVETFSKVKSEKSLKVAEEDKSDDFSKTDFHLSVEKPLMADVNLDVWAAKIRKYSEPFKKYPHVLDSSAGFQNEIRHKSFVNTEGTILSTPVNYMRLYVTATTKADDGMEMPLYLSYFGFKGSELPTDEKVMADIAAMIGTLEKLRTAPVVDPYIGPAILSGKASGVFFHEILGHRLEGHRQKSESDAQTFKKKVGEKVLPEFMSVVFDPAIKELHGLKLSGAYGFDDEGTKGEKVVCIENGILKDFLMSRTPIDNFPRSNGHARCQPGLKPVSRQSNLIVESKNILSEQKLRQMLIEECKKQNKAFGLIFTENQGGFTSTGRVAPNAFNVTPLAVFKVYTDGRPDELVRGVDLIGTPLTTFGKIMATGSAMEVFNGTCGAESGGVPVSSVSPSILVSEIEVQKKAKSQEKPPILPPPAKDKK
jgi:predicted Zn-dependent protease